MDIEKAFAEQKLCKNFTRAVAEYGMIFVMFSFYRTSLTFYMEYLL